MKQVAKREPTRIYYPVWKKIKENGKCFVPCLHKQQDRVIKAVVKEKYMDEDDKGNYGKLEIKKHPHGVEFNILVPMSEELF